MFIFKVMFRNIITDDCIKKFVRIKENSFDVAFRVAERELERSDLASSLSCFEVLSVTFIMRDDD